MSLKRYDEKVFAIDMIKDAYKTNDPVEIVDKAKLFLDIDLSINEIIDYLNECDNNISNTHFWSLNSKEIFYND